MGLDVFKKKYCRIAKMQNRQKKFIKKFRPKKTKKCFLGNVSTLYSKVLLKNSFYKCPFSPQKISLKKGRKKKEIPPITDSLQKALRHSFFPHTLHYAPSSSFLLFPPPLISPNTVPSSFFPNRQLAAGPQGVKTGEGGRERFLLSSVQSVLLTKKCPDKKCLKKGN